MGGGGGGGLNATCAQKLLTFRYKFIHVGCTVFILVFSLKKNEILDRNHDPPFNACRKEIRVVREILSCSSQSFSSLTSKR